MSDNPFIRRDAGPNPWKPTDRIDVQYADLSFGFDMAGNYHGERMWDWTSSSPNSHIIASRLAGNRFDREVVDEDEAVAAAVERINGPEGELE